MLLAEDAAQAEPVRLLAGVATAALLLGAAGCGGGGKKAGAPGKGAGTTPQLAPDEGTIRAADCRYWNVTSAAEHRNLLASFRAFFGAEADNGQRGPVMSDDEATRVLDNGCRPPYAAAFKLYKLYGRAAAFSTPGSG